MSKGILDADIEKLKVHNIKHINDLRSLSTQ